MNWGLVMYLHQIQLYLKTWFWVLEVPWRNICMTCWTRVFLIFCLFWHLWWIFKGVEKNHKIGKKIGISKEIQSVFNLRKKWFYLGTWKADFGYLPDPSLLMVIIYLALFRIFFDGRQRFKGEKRRREICYVVKYFPV